MPSINISEFKLVPCLALVCYQTSICSCEAQAHCSLTPSVEKFVPFLTSVSIQHSPDQKTNSITTHYTNCRWILLFFKIVCQGNAAKQCPFNLNGQSQNNSRETENFSIQISKKINVQLDLNMFDIIKKRKVLSHSKERYLESICRLFTNVPPVQALALTIAFS